MLLVKVVNRHVSLHHPLAMCFVNSIRDGVLERAFGDLFCNGRPMVCSGGRWRLRQALFVARCWCVLSVLQTRARKSRPFVRLRIGGLVSLLTKLYRDLSRIYSGFVCDTTRLQFVSFQPALAMRLPNCVRDRVRLKRIFGNLVCNRWFMRCVGSRWRLGQALFVVMCWCWCVPLVLCTRMMNRSFVRFDIGCLVSFLTKLYRDLSRVYSGLVCDTTRLQPGEIDREGDCCQRHGERNEENGRSASESHVRNEYRFIV